MTGYPVIGLHGGIMANHPFVTMTKPTGSFCNMRCRYCYYLNADNGETFERIRMNPELLERYISDYIQSTKEDVVSFTWHGGEPTLAGLDFYEEVVRLQKKYLPKGKTCWNNIQTNGLLIDEKWCEFLKREKFDIGVSIDGTRFVHDLYRVDVNEDGTYTRVKKAVELLEKYGIHPDLLCTVTEDTANAARSVYASLRSFHSGWIQFIPIVRYNEDGSTTEDSVTPGSYGRFLKEVFREWITHDLGRLNVQIFAETALVLSGRKANVCWFSETCGNVLIVERDGSVYACDHFVDQKHKLGNITDTSLSELADHPFQQAFGEEKKNIAEKCKTCPYEFICHGGCPKDRHSQTREYYLCDGLFTYFEYAVPLLRKAMIWSQERKTPAEIMKRIREEE